MDYQQILPDQNFRVHDQHNEGVSVKVQVQNQVVPLWDIDYNSKFLFGKKKNVCSNTDVYHSQIADLDQVLNYQNNHILRLISNLIRLRFHVLLLKNCESKLPKYQDIYCNFYLSWLKTKLE